MKKRSHVGEKENLSNISERAGIKSKLRKTTYWKYILSIWIVFSHNIKISQVKNLQRGCS